MTESEELGGGGHSSHKVRLFCNGVFGGGGRPCT
jgi:hypothetical protein